MYKFFVIFLLIISAANITFAGFKFKTKSFEESKDLLKEFSTLQRDNILELNKKLVEYYKSSFKHKENLMDNDYLEFSKLINLKFLVELQNVHLEKIILEIYGNPELKKLHLVKGNLPSLIFWDSELRYAKRESLKKYKNIADLNDIKKFHQIIYEQPLTKEQIEENIKYLKLLKVRQVAQENELKSLRSLGIDPVAHKILKELNKNPSFAIQYELLKQYSNSFIEANKKNNKVQINYLLQIKNVLELYPASKRVLPAVLKFYGHNQEQKKEVNKIIKFYESFLKPLYDSYYKKKSSESEQRKKEILKRKIAEHREHDKLKPTRIKEENKLKTLSTYLKSSLALLKNSDENEILNLLNVDNGTNSRPRSYLLQIGKYYKELNKKFSYKSKIIRAY